MSPNRRGPYRVGDEFSLSADDYGIMEDETLIYIMAQTSDIVASVSVCVVARTCVVVCVRVLVRTVVLYSSISH